MTRISKRPYSVCLLLAVLGVVTNAVAADALISGTVTDTEGQTLVGATVQVIDASGAVVAEDETNKRGGYKLRLPSGELKLRVTARGYAPLEDPLRVEAGANLSVDVKMIDVAADRRRRAIASFNAGAEAHRADDLETAARLYSEAAATDPDLPNSFLALAGVRLDLGNAAAAVEAIERYQVLQPGDPEGKKLALEAYRQAGLIDKAEVLAAELGVPVGTSNAATEAFNEGATASQDGDHAAAVEAFRRAAELRPDWAQAHAALGSSLYGLGQLEEATAAATRAVELEPGLARGLRVRYLALEALGDETFLDAWDGYYQANGDDAVTRLITRAELDIRDEKHDRARAPLKRLLAVRPDHAIGHYLMGLVLAASDPAAAKQHLETMLRLAPDAAEAEDARSLLSLL